MGLGHGLCSVWNTCFDNALYARGQPCLVRCGCSLWDVETLAWTGARAGARGEERETTSNACDSPIDMPQAPPYGSHLPERPTYCGIILGGPMKEPRPTRAASQITASRSKHRKVKSSFQERAGVQVAGKDSVQRTCRRTYTSHKNSVSSRASTSRCCLQASHSACSPTPEDCLDHNLTQLSEWTRHSGL